MTLAISNNGNLLFTLTLDYPTWTEGYHEDCCYQLRDAAGELASDIWTRGFAASMIRVWRRQGLVVRRGNERPDSIPSQMVDNSRADGVH